MSDTELYATLLWVQLSKLCGHVAAVFQRNPWLVNHVTCCEVLPSQHWIDVVHAVAHSWALCTLGIAGSPLQLQLNFQPKKKKKTCSHIRRRRLKPSNMPAEKRYAAESSLFISKL